MRTYVCVCLALLLSSCATLAPLPPLPRAGEISSYEALARVEQGTAVFVDVRAPQERKRGTPQGAIFIPFGPADFHARTATPLERAQFVEAIRAADLGGKEIILLCQYGVRSKEAQQTLLRAGIPSESVAGGWLGRNDRQVRDEGLQAWTE